MNIADLKARFGERLEGLGGHELSGEVAKLIDFRCYVDSDGSVWHVAGVAPWWPHECRNALAEAEAAWLTTDRRKIEYAFQLDQHTPDDPIVGDGPDDPRWHTTGVISARLLPPDVCCRCLLLAAGECES